MKTFLQNFLFLIGGKYSFFFNQEHRNMYKTQFTQYNDIYLLSFTFLKLLDSALKFSKEDIIKEYEKINSDESIGRRLFDKACYPNGDPLGFYNYSQYDLNNLLNNQNDIGINFREYMNSFDDNTKLVFDNYEFNTIIDFLDENDLLFEFLNDLNQIELSELKYKSNKSLKESYENFLVEFYKLKESTHDTPAGAILSNFLHKFLIDLLVTDIDLKKKKEIKIFDPFCQDGFLLFESKKLLGKKYPDLNIELYGKERDMTTFAICLSKVIIDKENPKHFVKVFDYKSQVLEIDENLKFDLIISNFGSEDIKISYNDRIGNSYSSSFEYMVGKLNSKGKMVSTFSSYTLTNGHLLIMDSIYLDYIESIIDIDVSNADSNLKVLVFNMNKSKKRKNKLLLIDSQEVMNELKDIHCVDATKPLLDLIKKYYSNFKKKDNAHLIFNSNVITDKKFYAMNRILNSSRLSKEDAEILNIKKLSEEKFYEIANSLDDYYFNHCNAQFNFNKLIRGEKKDFEGENVPLMYLGELTDLYNFPNPQIDDLNEIFLVPINKKDHIGEKIFIYQSELRGFHSHTHWPFKIKSDKVSKEYLYYYLNSNRGRYELKECTKGGSTIMRPDLSFIRVPVPSLDEQKKIVHAVEKSNEFFDSVNLLKDNFQNNILNYEHILQDIEDFQGDIEFSQDEYKFTKLDRNWRHVYEGLPWPLAITYLSATLGGFETVQKANAYLVLFEFVTLFNCIILISAIPYGYYEQNKDMIWNKNDKFYNYMSFGKWYKIYEFLKIIYLSNDFNPLINNDFLNELFDPNIMRSLDDAKNARNKDAHGAITNEFEAEELLKKLEPLLYNTFDGLMTYANFKLYYTLGKFERLDNGDLKQEVIMLNGPCAQPLYRDFIFEKELDPHSLYLFNPLTEDLLKINDNLMKFVQTDRIKNQWALYIYSGWDYVGKNKINAIYKCYQQTEKDLYIPIKSFSEDIK